MAKNENKTRAGSGDVAAFLEGVEPPRRKADAEALCDLMARVTGEPPVLWGKDIVGFGSYHYKTDAGREGDWMYLGFSPRKTALSLYFMPGYGEYDDILARLGKHKNGKACVYVNKLDDVDLSVLEELVDTCARTMRDRD
ncbi:MAG: DUF1801 domain-containing protein [Myxococcota bacterium]